MPKPITGDEPFGKAFKVLLGLASKGSVTIYGRGINDKQEPLYEVQEANPNNRLLRINLTAGEMVKALENLEKLKGEATQ